MDCDILMDIYQKQFELRNKEHGYWNNKSADLLTSASVLWDAMTHDNIFVVWDSYKMLMGLSFELLIKAICIAKNIEFDKTHRLNDLASLADIELSKIESEIFEVLTEYIIWDGKYPTPIKKQYLENHWKKENRVAFDDKEMSNGLILQCANDNLDFENLAKIWRKISSIYFLEANKLS